MEDLCIRVCEYIYIYIYINTHTHSHEHSLTDKRTQTHTHTHTHIYIYIYILKWVGPRRYLYFLEFIYLFCFYIRVCFQLVAFVREHIWNKALLMGYSMRVEIPRVCSLNDFHLLMGLYGGPHLFFFQCVDLSLLYPSLIFDMLLSWCVCVLEWFLISLTVIFLCVCVCVCVCVCESWRFLFVRMCGSVVWNLLVTFLRIIIVCVYLYISMYVCVHFLSLSLSIYIYIYIYTCVCVSVCVYVSTLILSSENMHGTRPS